MQSRIRILVGMSISLLLTSCGIPVATGPSPQRHVRYHEVTTPRVSWYPVDMGPEVLLGEGIQVSSVLPGPKGRIYYGTSDPLGDASSIGWYDPKTADNVVSTVPEVTPEFPKNAGLSNLSLSASAYWGAVSLVVAGQKNVWYRHWGYVGAWSSKTGKFIAGDYALPGPTVTQGAWTASVESTFSGQGQVKLMNLATKHVETVPLPDNQSVVDIALTVTPKPTVWLLSSATLWSLSIPSGSWQSVASLSSGNFFVAMGRWPSGPWIVDADGDVGRVERGQGIHWMATLSISPLAATSAGSRGLWVASPHHIALWEPHTALKTWDFPRDPYPKPASTWATSGSAEPPDWPPMANISAGPHGSVIIGYGTFIGEAKLVSSRQKER